MRKDVKFGLTVGAILVVTLIVYALVLSRSAQAIKSEEANNAPAPAAPGDSSPAPSANDDQATVNPAPIDNSQSSNTTDNSTASPTTQPTAQNDAKFDWNNALARGGKISGDGPERTVTPVGLISPDVHPPLIDSLPSTQPSLPPALSAPIETPVETPTPAPTPSVAPTIETPSPTVATETPRTHVIAEGESLWTIAQTVYGNGKYYTRLIAANPNIDPNHLKVGAPLSIPPLGSVAQASTSAAAPIAKNDSSTQYVVVSGDSLDKIARKLYGDPTMADRLYDANQTVIGQDEDNLKIGEVLKLPTPPTERQ
jgi:nucleoid-associated protein YgaU